MVGPFFLSVRNFPGGAVSGWRHGGDWDRSQFARGESIPIHSGLGVVDRIALV